MVGADPADSFVIAEVFLRFFSPEAQQFISGFHAETVVDVFEIPDIGVRQDIWDIRVRAQQFLHPLAEAAHAEGAGQRVLVDQPAQLLLLLQAEGPLPFHHDHEDRDDQADDQEENQRVLVDIIRQVIPVQAAGGIIQHDCLLLCFGHGGDTAVEALNDLPAFRRIRRAGSEIHGKHCCGLYCQVMIGRFLQHITPDIGVVQQCVHLIPAQGLHTVAHGLIQGDRHAWVKLADRFCGAAQGAQHAYPEAVQRGHNDVFPGDEGEWGPDQVVRNDRCFAGGAGDRAAEGQDKVILPAVQRVWQCLVSDGLQRDVIARFFRRDTDQVRTDADDPACFCIRIENRAAVCGHAHCERLAAGFR